MYIHLHYDLCNHFIIIICIHWLDSIKNIFSVIAFKIDGSFPDKFWCWKTMYQDKSLHINANNSNKDSIYGKATWYRLLC